jgi:CubicO group peptidase (beta-lactamase class C family)
MFHRLGTRVSWIYKSLDGSRLWLFPWGWLCLYAWVLPTVSLSQERSEAEIRIQDFQRRVENWIQLDGARDVSSVLIKICEETQLPALGCLVLRGDVVLGWGVVGVRKQGSSVPVTLGDKWHHGSITKSMTATVAARLVERGLIGWETTLAQGLPEKKEEMHSGWHSVTLRQLLGHRAGAPNSLHKDGLWNELWVHEGSAQEQRWHLFRAITSQPPVHDPGTTYEYANSGYTLAGILLEKVSGTDWETLMARELFEPLKMSSFGFGVPATPRYINQPWGHRWSDDRWLPIAPGPAADNPPAIGPGGTAHGSLQDLARYIRLHLRRKPHAEGYLTQESIRQLHTVLDGQDYAQGWNVTKRQWAGDKTVLNHTGSNTQWYTNVWLVPENDWACLVVANAGGEKAFKATDSVVGEMIGLFRP